MRSMFGVQYPMAPRWWMLGLFQPMSSPQMTRMFGLLATFCASAGETMHGSNAVRRPRIRREALLSKGAPPYGFGEAPIINRFIPGSQSVRGRASPGGGARG